MKLKLKINELTFDFKVYYNIYLLYNFLFFVAVEFFFLLFFILNCTCVCASALALVFAHFASHYKTIKQMKKKKLIETESNWTKRMYTIVSTSSHVHENVNFNLLQRVCFAFQNRKLFHVIWQIDSSRCWMERQMHW